MLLLKEGESQCQSIFLPTHPMLRYVPSLSQEDGQLHDLWEVPNTGAVTPISIPDDVGDAAAPHLFLATSPSGIVLISAHWPTSFQGILLAGDKSFLIDSSS